MEEIINQIVEYLKVHQSVGYLFAFLLSGTESTPFIGTASPGTALMLALGVLVSQGVYDIYLIIVFATLGSIAGDVITYAIGKRLKKRMGDKILGSEFIQKSQKFFNEHGDKSILLGKFVGPIRSVLPFCAGYMNMNYAKFISFTSVGSLIWAATYLILGNIFGTALEKVESFMSGLSLVILIVLALGFAYYAKKNNLIHREMRAIQLFKIYWIKVINLIKKIVKLKD